MKKQYEKSTLKYRVANIEDIPSLVLLLNQLFSQEIEFTPDETKQTIALNKIILDESIGDIFVAINDKKIVGMINILYTISTALGTKVAILEDMIIDENYRGKNIGSSLVEFVLGYIKQNGFVRVTLLTDSDNLKAHKFYKKIGFVQSNMIAFRKVL